MMGFFDDFWLLDMSVSPSQIESRLSSQTHSKSETESCSGHLTEVIDFAGRVPSGRDRSCIVFC